MATVHKVIRTAKNGSYAVALFEEDGDGSYVLVGYGLFSPDGDFLGFFATMEELHDYIDGLDNQYDRDRRGGYKP